MNQLEHGRSKSARHHYDLNQNTRQNLIFLFEFYIFKVSLEQPNANSCSCFCSAGRYVTIVGTARQLYTVLAAGRYSTIVGTARQLYTVLATGRYSTIVGTGRQLYTVIAAASQQSLKYIQSMLYGSQYRIIIIRKVQKYVQYNSRVQNDSRYCAIVITVPFSVQFDNFFIKYRS